MSLQYKSLAIVVGAKGEEIAQVAEALKYESQANTAKAQEILMNIRKSIKKPSNGYILIYSFKDILI